VKVLLCIIDMINRLSKCQRLYAICFMLYPERVDSNHSYRLIKRSFVATADDVTELRYSMYYDLLLMVGR